jgi:hypothetical protein
MQHQTKRLKGLASGKIKNKNKTVAETTFASNHHTRDPRGLS